jgi:hypothetical protein
MLRKKRKISLEYEPCSNKHIFSEGWAMVKTFNIVPASSVPLITLAAIGLVLILILGLFIFIGYSSRNVRFELSDQGLKITGGIYGRFIPKEAINAGEAEIINLETSQEYKPRLRTNGVGLPGYQEGWFKLKNSEKALLFVTDRSNVVYIPTTQDYSVMLSVMNTEEFYQSIKQWE